MRRRSFLIAGAACLATGPALAATESTMHAFDVAGSRIRLTIGAGPTQLSREQITDWIRGCTQAIANWYGRFPVHPLRIELSVGRGRGIFGGVTYGGGSPLIRAGIGRDSTLSDLEQSWVMVHELVHLACPRVPRAHHWLEEGLATYIEPWVRVGCGQISREKAWLDLVEGLPQGQPKSGDQGLDRTHSWGRTYWGGALFALELDLRLRYESDGSRGLANVLRGVVARGGCIRQDKSMMSLMSLWDDVADSELPGRLYRAHRQEAVSVDLPSIWPRLGVVIRNGAVVLDDRAALASTRRAIAGAV